MPCNTSQATLILAPAASAPSILWPAYFRAIVTASGCFSESLVMMTERLVRLRRNTRSSSTGKRVFWQGLLQHEHSRCIMTFATLH
jgi:hypothetical protein